MGVEQDLGRHRVGRRFCHPPFDWDGVVRGDPAEHSQRLGRRVNATELRALLHRAVADARDDAAKADAVVDAFVEAHNEFKTAGLDEFMELHAKLNLKGELWY